MLHPIEARWKFEDPTKLQLFSVPTPNGIKASAVLEEAGLPYEAHTVNIGKGHQHTPEYRTLSPNGKIPALIDPQGPGGEPLGIMESGAILLYVADKAKEAGGPSLVPSDPVGRSEALQWLFFQVGHIGPMFGQFGHFKKYAGDACDHPYPLERYRDESKRLLGVLEERLKDREHILGADYSICDIAIWPWLRGAAEFYEAVDDLEMKSHERTWDWLQRCSARPASKRAVEIPSW